MAITSKPQKAGYPLTFEIRSTDPRKRSWIKISQIRTLSTERIGRKIGVLKEEELDEIIEGLKEIIGG
jgi:mRNA interferase MazF